MIHNHNALMQSMCNFCSQGNDRMSTAVLKDICAKSGQDFITVMRIVEEYYHM